MMAKRDLCIGVFGVEADARVEKSVEKIDDEHGDHEKAAKEDSKSHNHGVIAPVNTMNHPLSKSWDGKDFFDHEAAGENLGGDGAEIGDDGEDRVAQAVAEGDLKEGKPFGKGCSYIVLLEDFNHVGAGEASDKSGGKGGKGKGRKNGVFKVSPTGNGEEVEFDAKKKLEKARENKIGDRYANGGNDHGGAVLPLPSFHGGPRSEKNARRDGNEKGLEAELR